MTNFLMSMTLVVASLVMLTVAAALSWLWLNRSRIRKWIV